ncbi:MAG: Na+/H+ antiporter NhaA [Spirochaetota bacterium]|nr:Na+/H+ antiporter NhaA [Spirochaetota bacterium]
MKENNQSFLHQFFAMESASGMLMIIATILAMIIANSPMKLLYTMMLEIRFAASIGDFAIDKPLLLWINDGLMAIFFFMIGLELKRELIEGELSNIKKVALPAIGAVGGMLVPALIYAAFNYSDPQALKGWAIPAATDIAFSLGILSLLGNRVPLSIKIFLTSLAIFDDLGAIIIIAFFYTANISFTALAVSLVCIPVLLFINTKGITSKSIYVIIGIVMWAAMLKSGVHATLAGVILALCIPLTSKDGTSPLREFEHDVHHAVAFIILPVFAFANTGIDFSKMTAQHLLHGVPIGIAAGLFIGKQAGISIFCYIAWKLGIASLPSQTNWKMLYGTALLCGIGFTMSLFIGSLAFEESSNLLFDERIGILAGSLLSGIFGYIVLHKALPEKLDKA